MPFLDNDSVKKNSRFGTFDAAEKSHKTINNHNINDNFVRNLS